MKKLGIYILTSFLILLPLKIKANLSDSGGWEPVIIVNRLCPTEIYDSWIIDDVRGNVNLNLIEVILKHHWNEREQKMADTQGSEFAESFVREIYKGYFSIIKGSYAEGDFMMYFALGWLFKQMHENDTSLMLTLIFPSGEKANTIVIKGGKLSPNKYTQ